jgi:hypothetical protein
MASKANTVDTGATLYVSLNTLATEGRSGPHYSLVKVYDPTCH